VSDARAPAGPEPITRDNSGPIRPGVASGRWCGSHTVAGMTEPPRPGDDRFAKPHDPTAPPPYTMPGEAPAPGYGTPPSSAPPSAPTSGGYAAPPAAPTSGGYGAPPGDPYGQPPASGAGYGAPPPASGAGYGAPPPGGAYGGYPAAGAPAPGYATADEKNWALIAHFGGALGVVVGGGLLGFVAPLIAYTSKGNTSPTVRAHALAALNFQITWALASVLAWILAAVTCFILFFVPMIVWLVPIIFGIIAGIKANEGQLYRYPMSINMIK